MMYIFSYDITDAKRLYRVAKILGKYAVRCQKSVFLFKEGKSITARELKEKLMNIMKEDDSLLMFPLRENDYQKCGLEENDVLLQPLFKSYVIL